VPSSSAIDNMVGELDDREKLRSKWSRRREVYAGQDINYINEYNRTYNNRINRAYDKYTVDIRQSLERGTG
jgi:pre-mRNA-splicing factor SYF2